MKKTHSILLALLLMVLVATPALAAKRNNYWFSQATFADQANEAFQSFRVRSSDVWLQEIYECASTDPASPKYRDVSRVISFSDPPIFFDEAKPYRLGYYLDYSGVSGLAWIDTSNPEFSVHPRPRMYGRLKPDADLEQVKELKAQITKLPGAAVDWAPGDKLFGISATDFSSLAMAHKFFIQFKPLFRLFDIDKNIFYKADEFPVVGKAIPISSRAKTIDLRSYYSDLSKSLTVLSLRWPPRHGKCEAYLLKPSKK